jgi:adenylate cyclase
LLWAAAFTACLAFLTSHNSLPEGPDKWTYDWRTYFFSQRASGQRSDIAMLLINDDTMAEYPYTVLDRGLLAVLIRALGQAHAKAIGLDFVFERPTEPNKDAALISAIRSSPIPVVLGAIDPRAPLATRHSIDYQNDFFAKAGVTRSGRVRAGHVILSWHPDLLTVGDQIVRFVSPPLNSKPTIESFARVLAEVDEPKRPLRSQYIDWLLPPANAEETFATVLVPEHKPLSNFEDTNSILPPATRTLFKNKTVIVGAEFVDRDLHFTPLSVADKRPVPGVTIQAQIVAQISDGRSVAELKLWQQSIIVFLLTTLGYLLGWRARLHQYATATHFISVVILSLVGFLVFGYLKLVIPTTALLFGWLAGIIGGHYSGSLLRWLGR